MKNIKSIIQKELNEKYEIDKAFNLFLMSENEEEGNLLFVNYLTKVFTEDRTDTESFQIVENQLKPTRKLMFEQETTDTDGEEGGNPIHALLKGIFATVTGDQEAMQGANDWIKSLGPGGLSAGKNWLIKQLFKTAGFKGPFAAGLASGLATIEVKNIIAMWRSPEYCPEIAKRIAPHIVSAFIAAIIESSTDGESNITLIFRQYITKVFEHQDFFNTISNTICKALHTSSAELKKTKERLDRLEQQKLERNQSQNNSQNNSENPPQNEQ